MFSWVATTFSEAPFSWPKLCVQSIDPSYGKGSNLGWRLLLSCFRMAIPWGILILCGDTRKHLWQFGYLALYNAPPFFISLGDQSCVCRMLLKSMFCCSVSVTCKMSIVAYKGHTVGFHMLKLSEGSLSVKSTPLTWAAFLQCRTLQQPCCPRSWDLNGAHQSAGHPIQWMTLPSL